MDLYNGSLYGEYSGASKEEVDRLNRILSLQNKGLELVITDGYLTLCKDGLSVFADFTHMKKRLLINNLNGELIIKAARIKNADKPLVVADATAGFGEDSFLLAAAGHSIKLFEYNPIICALLADALKRALNTPELYKTASRMALYNADSIKALPEITPPPDVVLLDPMFPERQKSASVKKKFQLIQQLESPCCDESGLLQAAMLAHPKKIIIKRPSKGPFLAGVKPNYSVEGKGIRYDCIVL